MVERRYQSEMEDDRDLISQSALLKHRKAALIGGKRQEYVPVAAIKRAELIDAESVIRCGQCRHFCPDKPPDGVLMIGERDGYCTYWDARTDSGQYCSRSKNAGKRRRDTYAG